MVQFHLISAEKCFLRCAFMSSKMWHIKTQNIQHMLRFQGHKTRHQMQSHMNVI